MKAFKRILAALAALILCFSLSASAWAADAAEPVAAGESDKIDFEGKSWDDIMDELLKKFDTSRDSVAVAYVNLVSGDEYFINPDTYMVAASMYKLPLNMYVTEKLQSGELEWSEYYAPYEEVRDLSIIYSDNDQSIFLYGFLGGYDKFRELTSDYMGTPYENLDPTDAYNNKYTAREFANCLKLLYNEQEKFPGIIETMQKAEPERFFKLYEPRFKIAHKYGYYSEYARVNMNDCGIAFTSEPIALVMFTQSVGDPEGLLTAYCTTMCEYTEYLVAKAAETPAPTPTPEPTPAPEAVIEPEAEEQQSLPLVSLGAVVLFLALGLALVIGLCVKFRLKFFWLLLALIISAAAMLACIVGMEYGTVYAKPSGDPQDTAAEFMDALCSGDYPTAYKLLRDYSDLGLETVPETAAARMAYEALHESFDYSFSGECSIVKLDASQPFSFTYLDLTAIESAVVEETPRQLKKLVESRSMSQIYDANRNYLPEVTEEAYLNAVSAVLANAESYYRTLDTKLSLSYSDGKWQVLASPALLRALNGGAGY